MGLNFIIIIPGSLHSIIMFYSDKITGHTCILVISVVSLVVNPGQTFPAPILLECHIKVLKAFGSCVLVVN